MSVTIRIAYQNAAISQTFASKIQNEIKRKFALKVKIDMEKIESKNAMEISVAGHLIHSSLTKGHSPQISGKEQKTIFEAITEALDPDSKTMGYQGDRVSNTPSGVGDERGNPVCNMESMRILHSGQGIPVLIIYSKEPSSEGHASKVKRELDMDFGSKLNIVMQKEPDRTQLMEISVAGQLVHSAGTRKHTMQVSIDEYRALKSVVNQHVAPNERRDFVDESLNRLNAALVESGPTRQQKEAEAAANKPSEPPQSQSPQPQPPMTPVSDVGAGLNRMNLDTGTGAGVPIEIEYGKEASHDIHAKKVQDELAKEYGSNVKITMMHDPNATQTMEIRVAGKLVISQKKKGDRPQVAIDDMRCLKSVIDAEVNKASQ